MSTLRLESMGPIDTGCQFLSIENPVAMDLFQKNLAPGVLKEIPSSILCVPDGFVIEAPGRYYLAGGMDQWAQAQVESLAKKFSGFKLHLNFEVKNLEGLWAEGFTHILVTVPGETGKNLGAKSTVEYHPCLTLVFSWHDTPSEALEYYGFRDIDNREGISWLAHESIKHGKQGIWVAQVTPHTSKLWNRAQLNTESLEDLMNQDLGKWIPLFGKGEKTLIQTQYWEKAFPVQFEEIPNKLAFEKQQTGRGKTLYYLGDGYRGFGRTENAIESAIATVNDIFETQ